MVEQDDQEDVNVDHPVDQAPIGTPDLLGNVVGQVGPDVALEPRFVGQHMTEEEDVRAGQIYG